MISRTDKGSRRYGQFVHRDLAQDGEIGVDNLGDLVPLQLHVAVGSDVAKSRDTGPANLWVAASQLLRQLAGGASARVWSRHMIASRMTSSRRAAAAPFGVRVSIAAMLARM